MGSLVAIWFTLGGLVLAEQLNILSETGSHDEQALTHLQLAVKSEPLDASIESPSTDLLALSSMVSPSAPVALVFSNLTGSLSNSTYSRSLSLFTCCYRL